MLTDTGVTMHVLLCLILVFNDIEDNRPVRGFNDSERLISCAEYFRLLGLCNKVTGFVLTESLQTCT
jgi:hypothetical protein